MKEGRMKLIRIAAAAMLAVLLAFGATSAATTPTAEEKKLEDIQKEINQTKSTLSKVKTEEKNTLKALQNIESDLANTKYRITKAGQDLAYLKNRLVNVEKELAAADAALEVTQKDYAKAARNLEDKLVAIYKAGNPKYMEMLFNSKSFTEFMSKSDYLRAMVEYDRGTLETLKQKQQDLADKTAAAERKKKELENTNATIAALKSQLEADEKSLTAKYADREKYLSQIQSERLKWEKELAEEEKQSRELESIIRSKQDSRTTTSTTSKFLGKLIWPVDGGWVSSEYGWRISPIFGDRRFHSGIDIAVPTGTPVKAVADGKVLESRWINGYGYTVILDHGSGISTLYAHNSRLLVKPGQSVKLGFVVSKAGSTGWSTGPHVHFEVRENGVAKEPRNYLIRK